MKKRGRLSRIVGILWPMSRKKRKSLPRFYLIGTFLLLIVACASYIQYQKVFLTPSQRVFRVVAIVDGDTLRARDLNGGKKK